MAKLEKLPSRTAKTLEKNILKVYLVRGHGQWHLCLAPKDIETHAHVPVCEKPISEFLSELNEANQGQMYEITITRADNKIIEV